MSAPLFTEDRYSTSSGSDQEACDSEVCNITRGCAPSEAPTVVMSPRPSSNSTVDYSTQGDPDQPAPSPQQGLSADQQCIKNNLNFLLQDGSRRTIYDIPAHELHSFPDMLENGHRVFQIELPNLQPILETSTYLMDCVTGQFYAVNDDGYREMATTKRMLYPWQNGQLIAALQETRQQFGLPPRPEVSPAHQPAASQCLPPPVIQQSQGHPWPSAVDDEAVLDRTDEPPHPRVIPYLEPSLTCQI